MEGIVELWKPVVGYEGLYEVSDQGRVRSLPGERWNGQAMHKFKGRILKLHTGANIYYHVVLSKNGKVKTCKVHQLVADAFLPSCPGIQGKTRGLYHIDHINNSPIDNRAVNLQWLTGRENVYVKPNRNRDKYGRFQ